MRTLELLLLVGGVIKTVIAKAIAPKGVSAITAVAKAKTVSMSETISMTIAAIAAMAYTVAMTEAVAMGNTVTGVSGMTNVTTGNGHLNRSGDRDLVNLIDGTINVVDGLDGTLDVRDDGLSDDSDVDDRLTYDAGGLQLSSAICDAGSHTTVVHCLATDH